jgi:hypothetical protein
MHNTHTHIHNFTSLHQLIVSRHKHDSSASGIQQLNIFMTELKSRGIIDGIEVGGHKGKYLLFDGDSWLRACRHTKYFEAPSFVMWEESAFFALLEKLITMGEKSHKTRVLPGKHVAHT